MPFKDKEKKKEYQKQYRREHPRQRLASDQKYRRKHRKEMSEYQQRYYQQHRKEKLEYGKCYRQKNQVKVKERHHQYYHTIGGYLAGILRGIKQRCNNPARKDYKYYGARGIKCLFKPLDEFRNYVIDDLGYSTYEKIKGLQIDRINNDGHYKKGNIQFITCKENLKNRRKYETS